MHVEVFYNQSVEAIEGVLARGIGIFFVTSLLCVVRFGAFGATEFLRVSNLRVSVYIPRMEEIICAASTLFFF